jgi:hypothetical protein
MVVQPILASLPRHGGRSKALGPIAVRVPTHGPNGGAPDSLDEAKAAFRATWERPASAGRSGVIGLAF